MENKDLVKIAVLAAIIAAITSFLYISAEHELGQERNAAANWRALEQNVMSGEFSECGITMNGTYCKLENPFVAESDRDAAQNPFIPSD